MSNGLFFCLFNNLLNNAINYTGDVKYLSENTSCSISVNKADSIKTGISVFILQPISFGDDVDIHVVATVTSGNVSLYVDGVEYVLKLNNGNATYSLNAPACGNHRINVVFLGNATHSNASASLPAGGDKGAVCKFGNNI